MASLDAAKAEMAEFATSSDLEAAGADAGLALSTGVKDGTKDLEADLGAVGADAGAALSGGVKDATSNLEADLGTVGVASGTAMREGVRDASSGLEDDLAGAGLAGGVALSGGVKEGVSDIAPAFDDIDKQLADGALFNLPALSPQLKKLGSDAEDMGSKVESSTKAASGGITSLLETLGVPSALLGGWGKLGLAVAGIGVVAIDLGKKMQTAEATIAAATGSTIQQAQAVGNAFLDTAGKTEYSGQELAAAYGSVAGQLEAVQGRALSAAQATKVMNAAIDLGEASGEDLTTSISALANVMQAYGIKASGAQAASDALFQSARLSGNNMAQVAKAVQQLHTQLGAMTPPLGQVGGLLVDLANHGETGSRAIRSVSSAFTTMLKSSSDLISTQKALATATAQLPPSLHSLAAQYSAGTITASQLTAATGAMTESQTQAWGAFTKASTAVDTANTKYASLGLTVTNAKGQFVGIKSVIAQLGPALQGMTQQQQLAALTTIFGSTAAAKLLDVIKAGPAAYDKATAEVEKAGAAHAAAAKQAATLSLELKTVKATAEDWEIDLSHGLIPILGDVVAAVAKVIPIIGKVLVAAFQLVRPAITDAMDALKILFDVLKPVFDFIVDHKPLLIAALAGIAAAFAPLAAAIILTMSPIEAVIAAVVALAFAVHEVIEHWSAIAGFFVHMWDDVKKVFDEGIHWIEDHWKTLAEVIAGIVLLPIAILVAPFIIFRKQIAKVWDDIAHDASEAWGAVVGAIEEPLKSFGKWFDSYRGEIDAVMGGIADAFKAIWGAITAVFKAGMDILTNIATAGWDVIKGAFRLGMDAITAVVKAGVAIFTPIFKVAFDIIRGAVQVAWTEIQAIVKVGMDALTTVVKVDMAVITAVFKIGWDAITTVARVAGDAITAVFRVAFDILKGIVEVGLDLITGHWSRAWHDLVTTVESVGGAIKSAVQAIFSDIIGFFANAGTWLFDAGKAIIEGLVNGIKNAAKAVGDAIKGVAHDVVGVAKSVLGIFSPSSVFHDLGANVMQGLANGISDNKELASAELKSLNLATALDQTFSAISVAATAMGADIAKAAQSLTTLATAGTATKAALDTITAAGMTDFLTEFDVKMDDFTAQWKVDWTTIATATASAFSIITGFLRNIQASGLAVLQSAMLQFTSIWTGAWHAASSMVASAWDTIRGALTAVALGVAQLGTSVNSLESSWSAAWRAIANAVVAAFAGVTSEVNTIGQNIMSGLINGIDSKGSAVSAAATNAVTNAVNAAKAAAGTHSPSVIFHEIGMNMMQGLANGITGNAGLVSGALGGVKNTLSGAGLGLSAGGVGGVLPISGGAVGGGGAPQVITVQQPINITLNGQTVAQQMIQIALRMGRSQGNIFGQYAGGNQTGAATGVSGNAIAR